MCTRWHVARGSAVLEGVFCLTFLMLLAIGMARLWAVVLRHMTRIMQ